MSMEESIAAYFQKLRDDQRVAADELKEEGLDCGCLNPHLVKSQNLTQADIDEVNVLHELKNDLFKVMTDLDPQRLIDRLLLRACVPILEEIEFAMQRGWKFDEDSNRHTWWFVAPHCQCPTMDNRDPLMPNRIMTQSCPLHGWEEGETPPPSELDS